jgi:microcystin-dependent protein
MCDKKLSIIIVLVVVIFYLLYNNSQENADNVSGTTTTPSTLSNEAIQNIASVYNNQNMTVNNLNATGIINFSSFKGIIVAWSGAISDIPIGWKLCDGTKYKALDGSDLQSPDLRSKFIVGASKPGTSSNGNVNGNVNGWGPDGQQSYPNMPLAPRMVADQGGEENHKLTTNEIPSHKHAATKSCMGSDPTGDWSTYTDMRSTHGWNCQDRSGGKEIFTNWGNDPNTGAPLGNGAHNNMPPFYALAYIIKL